MGGGSSKEAFKSSITDLINNQQVSFVDKIMAPILSWFCSTRTQAVANLDDSFWERYWSDSGLTSHDFFVLVSRQDVHDMMDKASGNLTALCFKVREREREKGSVKQ